MIIAIDQGSSATKILVIDPRSGKIIKRKRIPLKRLTGVEIVASVKSALSFAGDKNAVIGIASQRSTLCFFSKEGVPKKMLIPWWEHRKSPGTDPGFFRASTGLPLLPNWWAGKLSEHLPIDSSTRVGTVDTLLLAALTRGRSYRTDFSNAARTGLLDIHKRRRTRELLELFRIPRDLPLPEISPSLFDFGANVHAMMGDAGASLMGATGGARGILNLTLGTGGFLHYPVEKMAPPEGLYLAPAWQAQGRIRWTLEAAVPGMASVYKEELKKGRKLDAIYDGLAALLARAIERFPEKPRLIVAGGGLSHSDSFLQKISDLSGLPVAQARDTETTAWGAAMLAARSIGVLLKPIGHHPPLMPRS